MLLGDLLTWCYQYLGGIQQKGVNAVSYTHLDVYKRQPQKATRGISDGVFIAIDASKDYLKKDQKMIEDQSLAGKKRDLNE